MKVIIKTNRGNININLFEKDSPITVANFVNLIKRRYYDNTIFHRVIEDFMAQGGDPTGTGYGGPGYKFKDELYNGHLFDKPGYLAMANSGPNTNGSQFFITTVETTWLNNKHTIFGQLENNSDLEIVKSLKNGDNIFEIIVEDIDNEFMISQKEYLDKFNEILDNN